MNKIINAKVNDNLYLYLKSISEDNIVTARTYRYCRGRMIETLNISRATFSRHLKTLCEQGLLEKLENGGYKLLEEVVAPKNLWPLLIGEPGAYRAYAYLKEVWDTPAKAFTKNDMMKAYGYMSSSGSCPASTINNPLAFLEEQRIVTIDKTNHLFKLITHLEQ